MSDGEEAMLESGSDGNIPTTLRLLIVLEEVARTGRPLTPTEANANLGLPKPTIHRLFSTLETEGFLQRDLDGVTFSPGRRLRALATGVLSSLRVRMARVAALTALAEEIGETCNIVLPDRDGMVYLDRVETKWPLRIQLPIGSRVPFHCTASGKMYLSSLNDAHLRSFLRSAPFKACTDKTLTTTKALRKELALTRERGYAIDNEEFIDGMIAIAVPIEDGRGRFLSALACHAPTLRLSLAAAESHRERLQSAAEDLSRLVLDGE